MSRSSESRRTGLQDLPQELFQAIMEYSVLSCGLYKSVRLRLVNGRYSLLQYRFYSLIHAGLFDREILRVICATSVINLANYSRVASMNVPMMTRLLFERVKTPGTSSKGRLSYQGGPLPTIRRTVEHLQALCGQEAEEQRFQLMYALCAAVADHLQYRQFFGRLGVKPLPDDYLDEPDKPIDLLTAAACVGNMPMLNVLLWSGICVDAGSDIFGHPLNAAARRGDNEMLLLLLNAGFKPPLAHSPLGVAALAGHENTVRLLLGLRHALTVPNPEHNRAITSAVHGGHGNLVLLLTENRKIDHPTDLQSDLLWEASRHGRAQVVRMMLEDGANIDWRNSNRDTTAIQEAASRGHAQVVWMLIANGADLHRAENESAMNRAARNGHEKVIEILLDNGAYLNANGLKTTPLGAAAANGEVSMMRFLLSRGADVHAHKCGEIALFIAAGKGYDQVVQLLVDSGVNPNGPGPEGKNPMLQALVAGQSHVGRTLKKLGAKEVNPAKSIYAAQFASGRFPYVMYKE